MYPKYERTTSLGFNSHNNILVFPPFTFKTFREYRENVDMVKQQLMEVKAAKIARAKQKPAVVTKELSDESSSDEGDDDDEIFSMDWRAQHL